VTISNLKSEKNGFKSGNFKGKSVFLKPQIGTFGIGIHALETLILGFRKVFFDVF